MRILLGNSLANSLRQHFKSAIEANSLHERLPASIGKFPASTGFSEHMGNIKGENVVIIQTLAREDNHSTNDFAAQLYFAADAAKEAGAKNIWVITPYNGYARQDRHVDGRNVSIGIKTYSKMLKGLGVIGHSLIDIHSEEGLGHIKDVFGPDNVFNLTTTKLFAETLEQRLFSKESISRESALVGGPDAGADPRVDALARELGVSTFRIRKKHKDVSDTEITGHEGNVKDKITITVDDEIDTAGTMSNAQTLLAEQGSIRRIVCAAHPVLSKGGLEKIFTAGARNNRSVSDIIFTDTIDTEIPYARIVKQYDDIDDLNRIQIASVGPMLWHHIANDIANHPAMQLGVS